VGKINDQVTVISIDHLPRNTPLYGAVGRGLLVVCCLMDLPLAKCPTRRKIAADLNRRPDATASRLNHGHQLGGQQ